MSDNKMKLILVTSAAIALACPISAKKLTAIQTGNILHIRYGQERFDLISPTKLDEWKSYRIEIPLTKEEEKKAEAPALTAAEPAPVLPTPAPPAPTNIPAPGVSPPGSSEEDLAEALAKEETAKAKKGKVDVSSKLFAANQFYLKEKYLKAFALIQEAINEDPKNARAWAMRGSLFDATGDHKKALEDWQKAYDFAPEGSSLRDELIIKLPSK